MSICSSIWANKMKAMKISYGVLLFFSSLFSIQLSAQSFVSTGSEEILIRPGTAFASVDGVQLAGSSANIFALPYDLALANTPPYSKRVLITNASSRYEMKGVPSSGSVQFFSDVLLSSQRNAVDVSITNKTSTAADYSIGLEQTSHSGYVDIPLEWIVTRVGATSTDRHDLTFSWTAALDPSSIADKVLFRYDDILEEWIQLPGQGQTLDEANRTLTITDFEGALNNTRFMIAQINNFVWLGTTSTDWATGTNWEFGSAPSLGTEAVTIPAAVTNMPIIGSDVTVGLIDIAANAQLTVPSGRTLTITGNLVTNSSNLTIADGGSLLTTGTSPTLGSVKVQRTGTEYSNVFNYWSTPVSGATYSSVWDFGTGGTQFNAADFYTFDPTQITGGDPMTGWQSISTGATMTPGQGFIGTGMIDGGTNSLTFTGAPNNGDKTYTVQTDNGGYNLIGNPYPSAIDADAFYASNSTKLTGTFWFWDVDLTKTYSTSDYATYTQAGGTGSNPYGANPDQYIESCQGFFVEALTDNVPVTFTNAHRVAGNNLNFYKTGNRERMWLYAQSSGDDYNKLLIAFSDEATDGYDQGWDGKKLKGNPNISFYSKLQGEDYAIQALAPHNGQEKRVALGLDAGSAGSYTIAIDSIDGIDPLVSIYLYDQISGRYHDLRQSGYTFNVNAANTTITQYELVFNAAPVGVDQPAAEAYFHAFVTGSDVVVRTNGSLTADQVRLIDVQGRVLAAASGNGAQEVRLDAATLAAGMYLVEVTTVQGIQTQKILIH